MISKPYLDLSLIAHYCYVSNNKSTESVFSAGVWEQVTVTVI